MIAWTDFLIILFGACALCFLVVWPADKNWRVDNDQKPKRRKTMIPRTDFLIVLFNINTDCDSDSRQELESNKK